jgi:hypothetical protein
MPRRALIPGDIVAASPHRRGRQAHLADRLDPGAALREGVLVPHVRYKVMAVGRRTPAMTSQKLLLVGTPEQPIRGKWRDLAMVCAEVRPSAVRLWTNPQERRRRYLTEAAAKIQRRKAAP